LKWHLALGWSVGVESVISSGKYKPLIELAKANNYLTAMIYVGLASVELAIQRVAARTAKGGHDVAESRIRQRWSRSIENLCWFAKLVDRLLVYDNSDSTLDHPVRLVADGRAGRTSIYDRHALPEVANRLLLSGAVMRT
jgi:predicted ABC-type ATPase